MSEELKPCPFCASNDLTHIDRVIDGSISCNYCGAFMQLPEKSMYIAIKTWNNRATDTETADLREQVKMLREALIDGLEQLESWEVLIDGEWGSCRTLEQLEEIGWLSNATIKCRQALAATAPKGE